MSSSVLELTAGPVSWKGTPLDTPTLEQLNRFLTPPPCYLKELAGSMTLADLQQEYAEAQDVQTSEVISDQRNPERHPKVPIELHRGPHEPDPLSKGLANAMLATRYVLYGLRFDLPSMVVNSGIYFELADRNFRAAGDLEGCGRNAARAVEVAAIIGDDEAFVRYCDIAAMPLEEAVGIWCDHQEIRDRWMAVWDHMSADTVDFATDSDEARAHTGDVSQSWGLGIFALRYLQVDGATIQQGHVDKGEEHWELTPYMPDWQTYAAGAPGQIPA